MVVVYLSPLAYSQTYIGWVGSVAAYGAFALGYMRKSRSSSEPRFSRVAALIADPSLARMLALLLVRGGRHAAGDLGGVSEFSRLFGAAFRQ